MKFVCLDCLYSFVGRVEKAVHRQCPNCWSRAIVAGLFVKGGSQYAVEYVKELEKPSRGILESVRDFSSVMLKVKTSAQRRNALVLMLEASGVPREEAEGRIGKLIEEGKLNPVAEGKLV